MNRLYSRVFFIFYHHVLENSRILSFKRLSSEMRFHMMFLYDAIKVSSDSNKCFPKDITLCLQKHLCQMVNSFVVGIKRNLSDDLQRYLLGLRGLGMLW